MLERLDRPARAGSEHVPVALMAGIIAVLSALGHLSPRLAAKAELARIGRYYATQSMLVWDAASQRYDADADPGIRHRPAGGPLRRDAARRGRPMTAGAHAIF